MSKYQVRIKYGKPGKPKHNIQTITVEADSESSAESIAISKFRNSNLTYKDKEVDVIGIKEEYKPG